MHQTNSTFSKTKISNSQIPPAHPTQPHNNTHSYTYTHTNRSYLSP